MRFRCYGADQEDLTAKVVAAVGEPVEERLRETTVLVQCSQAHKNVFGSPLDGPFPVVRVAVSDDAEDGQA